jgi:hypothetical protein
VVRLRVVTIRLSSASDNCRCSLVYCTAHMCWMHYLQLPLELILRVFLAARAGLDAFPSVYFFCLLLLFTSLLL